MTIKERLREVLRFLAPCGLIEWRHNKALLRRLSVSESMLGSPWKSSKLVSAASLCSYPLWHNFIKNLSSGWTLIDVGANYGQFTSAVLNFARPTRLVLIDPQKACADYLTGHFSCNKATRVICAAVGSKKGVVDLHCTKSSKVASVLEPHPDILPAFPDGDFEVKGIAQVDMVMLDEILEGEDQIGLLKIDVQGFELEVLKGAASVLTRTAAVLIEINYVRHYVSQSGFNEINTFLYNAGFELRGISEPKYNSEGIPLWADAVYGRIR